MIKFWVRHCHYCGERVRFWQLKGDPDAPLMHFDCYWKQQWEWLDSLWDRYVFGRRP